MVLELDQDMVITVGRLGRFSFPAGGYVYVGSALGSGGLTARLRRHRRSAKKFHWHVDYFLAQARLKDVFADESGQRLECAWAHTLLSLPGARVPAARFGASDCRCPSHLIYVGDRETDSKAVLAACGAVAVARSRCLWFPEEARCTGFAKMGFPGYNGFVHGRVAQLVRAHGSHP